MVVGRSVVAGGRVSRGWTWVVGVVVVVESESSESLLIKSTTTTAARITTSTISTTPQTGTPGFFSGGVSTGAVPGWP